MSDDLLRYDYTFMMAEAVGEHGGSEEELARLQPRLEEIQQQFLYDKDNSLIGFARLPFEGETALSVQSLAATLRQEFDTLVVLGIGGSDLGARALHEALNHTYYNELPHQAAKLYFAGNNTDPKALADLLDVLDLDKTVVNVISKSGDTIETMASFVLLWQRLVAELGEKEAGRHVVVSTDAEHGSLRAIVQRRGFRSLIVPEAVGGRYSVLSTVGLLPAAFVGMAVDELLAGAREMDDVVVSAPVLQNPAMVYAGLQYLANMRRGQSLSVLMPYGDGLRGIAQWYRQLWAESLGKRVDLDGKEVYVGPTPIAAVGATDQHSQMQLYNEGPFDKVITFVEVSQPSRSLALGEVFDGVEELDYLKHEEFGHLIGLERQASAMALARNGRPNGTIFLSELDERHLGALLYFFELAVMYSGGLYRVDAFDQPGVEAGKQAMYALLGRQGFAEQAKEWEPWQFPKKKFEVGG